MANYFLVFTIFVLGTCFLGGLGDENPYSRGYTPLPFRNYDRGLNMLGGKTYIRELPDLVNLVFGLGGHIVGRAGWIIHDAFQSLFDGLATSEFKLRSHAAGHLPGEDDGVLGVDDLFGGLLG
ncbi:hypothetical protein ElyMa_001132200 [Elysia marginata]|uniref:Uncharacterized protein n=1 Tax=Elysia marginata TaxID=1093978 RepID=A0AAV4I0W7_9GAST|nr:hypothetical protein ElyMa_001132200 [Elysia marginata]